MSTLVCALLITLLTVPSQLAGSQPTSDESGTLVIVGRTADAVVVSVDSKITHTDPRPSANEGRRKLVDVGTHGACAILGFLGLNSTEEFDVSAALRAWVSDHPRTEAREALGGLLAAAGGAWDRAGYYRGALPAPQAKDGSITTLICGDFVDGRPAILVGHTVVRWVGPTRQHAESKLEPVAPTALLICRGNIDELVLRELATNDQAHLRADEATFPSLRDIAKDMSNDFGTTAALRSLYETKVLSEANLQMLLKGTFAAVERHDPSVAGPNNVRVIRSCGRFDSRVESDPWPGCATTPTKR